MALTDEMKTEIRDALKRIVSTIPGFRSRRGQREMIAIVARTLGAYDPNATETGAGSTTVSPRIACIKGGTGVGKSLAYILPTVILAKHFGLKVVISSSTIALQDQLLRRDLPAFLDAAGLPRTMVVAKGRTRYACNWRLQRAAAEASEAAKTGRLFGDDQIAKARAVVRLEKSLSAETWDGDRSTSEVTVSDETWRSITTDGNGCLGRTCKQYSTCAQMRARARYKEADIIVANHDLVLSNLILDESELLPPPGGAFYIFDEAHHLSEKAINAFAKDHSISGVVASLRQTQDFASEAKDALSDDSLELVQTLARESDQLFEQLEAMERFLGSLDELRPKPGDQIGTMRLRDSLLQDVPFQTLGKNVLGAARAALVAITEIGARLALAKDTHPDDLRYDTLMTEALAIGAALEGLERTWTPLLEADSPDKPPLARWVERHERHGTATHRVFSSPIDASEQLHAALWRHAAGAICTSASLTPMGSFDYFLKQTGLSLVQNVTCAEVQSPFDYYNQATLYIPRMRASPKNVQKHTEDVLGWVRSSLTREKAGGVLVLFTSKRQMREVFERLNQEEQRLVLVQDTLPLGELIRAHRARIDGGERSALFGVHSLWEGIDLPGQYCNLELIAKLPFNVPDTPIDETRKEWIEARGGDHFEEVVLPATGRMLEQGCGRLIRTEDDAGEIVVLDARLWSNERYQSLLRGLPPFRIVAFDQERFI